VYISLLHCPDPIAQEYKPSEKWHKSKKANEYSQTNYTEGEQDNSNSEGAQRAK